MVIDDFQSSSSFRMLRQTVPEGYTFGCGRTGLNWPGLEPATFWRSQRIVSGKVHVDLVDSSFPNCLGQVRAYVLRTWYLAVPLEHVDFSAVVGDRLGHESLVDQKLTKGWSFLQFYVTSKSTFRSMLSLVRTTSLASLPSSIKSKYF